MQGEIILTVLLDTNIILDYIAERPFYKSETKQIFEMIYSHKISGIIAAHSISNLWYLLRKICDDEQRRKIISSLLNSFEIAQIDKSHIKAAIERKNFKDFEVFNFFRNNLTNLLPFRPFQALLFANTKAFLRSNNIRDRSLPIHYRLCSRFE
jgi:predicted nucleic-acid-binding protein